MIRARKWLVLGLGGIVLLVVGCGLGALGRYLLRPPAAPPSTLRVGWVAPDEGALLPAGEPVSLQVWASGSPEAPPRYLMLWLGDRMLGYTQGPHDPLALGAIWIPPRPGMYTFFAQAVDERGRVLSVARSVTVQPAPDDPDGDGVPGGQDACPDQWGRTEDGCVWDEEDVLAAQEAAAPPSSPGGEAPPSEGEGAGVPVGPPILILQDQDQDGVPDLWDACPEAPGLLEDQGCPVFLTDLPDLVADWAPICQQMPAWCDLLLDEDGDGVANGEDRCPQEPGLAVLDGCPLAGWRGADAGVEMAGRVPVVDPCTQLLEPARSLCEVWRGTPPEERPEARVEIQLGQRIYTDVDWRGLVCYTAINGLWLRLPPDEQHLLGSDGVWDLGGERYRTLRLRVPLRPLALRFRCYGYAQWAGEEWVGAVPLGQVVLHLAPSQWDGLMHAATGTSRGPSASGFQVFYRVCVEACP